MYEMKIISVLWLGISPVLWDISMCLTYGFPYSENPLYQNVRGAGLAIIFLLYWLVPFYYMWGVE